MNEKLEATQDFRIVKIEFITPSRIEYIKIYKLFVILSKYHCPIIMDRSSTFFLHSSTWIDFHWSTIAYLSLLNYYPYSLSTRVRRIALWWTRVGAFPRFFILTQTSCTFFHRLEIFVALSSLFLPFIAEELIFLDDVKLRKSLFMTTRLNLRLLILILSINVLSPFPSPFFPATSWLRVIDKTK